MSVPGTTVEFPVADHRVLGGGSNRMPKEGLRREESIDLREPQRSIKGKKREELRG